MILVTGATGHLGNAVVQHLLKTIPASQIAILARQKEKAIAFETLGVTVKLGDFDDTIALQAALNGIEQVVLISGTDPVHRLQQHKNVVDAAVAASVKRIIYTSIAMESLATSHNQFLMESHFKTEAYIEQSGLTYSFFKNNLYTDTIPLFAGDNPFAHGITLPTGSGKVAFAWRNDIAEAIANHLLQPINGNQVFQITGNVAYNFEEIATMLSTLSGKQVTFTHVDATTYENMLQQVGVPTPLIPVLLGFTADISNHQHQAVATDLEKLLGRKPTEMAAALKTMYQL